jgi:protein SCO1
MSTESNNTSSSSSRSKMLMLGSVLWILAIGALFFVWKNSNMPEKDSEQGDIVVLQEDDEEEDDNNGKPRTIVVKMFPFELMDFNLTERNGQEITKKDLLGKPWAVSFIFINCAGPCYQITSQMAKLQKKLKDDDIRLVTITVDPKNDTPERLQKYAATFQADPNKWLFLTGDQDKVYELINLGFKQSVLEDTSDTRQKGFEIAHSSNIMLVNAEGIVLEKYNGQIDSEMVKLRKAIKKEVDSLKETSQEKEEEKNKKAI